MKQILCFGDSNTWGLVPGKKERFGWGVRWTSLLQEKLDEKEYHIIEEGLCGRTTIFDDVYRDNRNGLKTLPLILEAHSPIDYVILMLGTNDCKSHYKTNAYKIGKGLEQCLDKIAEYVPREKILIVSPIHLGDAVWKAEYDPEFDQNSVEVSKTLAAEYKKIATERKVHFLDAARYVTPSKTDQEHLDAASHKIFAETVYNKIQELQIA